jgi:hypothetical protein
MTCPTVGPHELQFCHDCATIVNTYAADPGYELAAGVVEHLPDGSTTVSNGFLAKIT